MASGTETTAEGAGGAGMPQLDFGTFPAFGCGTGLFPGALFRAAGFLLAGFFLAFAML